MLVNGSAYVVQTSGDYNTSAATQTVRCLTSIAPFDSIVAALNNLTAVSSELENDDDEVDCPSGNLYETSFGGKEFVVCGSGADGFIAYGGDITMAVEYLDSPLSSIPAPTLSDGITSCDVVSTPTLVTPTTLALLTGDAATSTCSSLISCLA